VISYKMARRSFLRQCGGSAALLLPMLRGIEARAAGTPAPLRFLVIHHPLGTQIDKWRPQGGTSTDFTLPYISAPFAPLKSKMLMIDGLRIVTAQRGGGTAGEATHEGGMVALMTGQPTLGRIGQQDHAAGGASIDQIFLQRSPRLGGPNSVGRTSFSSLQLAADIRSDRDEIAPRVLSYLDPIPTVSDPNSARQPLKPETDPSNVFNRLFGGGIMPTGDLTLYLKQRKSVLDFMRSDLARLRKLIPAGETVKLDSQADAIRQLESSIALSVGASDGSCMKPGVPPVFTQDGKGATGMQAPLGGGSSTLSGVDYYYPNLTNDPTNPDDHPHWKLGMIQLGMIRAAFACDLVRVATFMWSAGTNWVVFPGTFNGQTIMGGPQSSQHHPPSHTTDVNTLAWLAEIDAWYATRTSEALQQFDALTDIDGNSLLDNTVVAYVSEVGRAFDHDERNVPFALFGGKNTRLQTGQFLKITSGPQTGLDGPGTNRPTNDAWLALAPVFGITDLTKLGADTQFSGILPGIVTP
jgi:hypothetical protein